MAASPPVPMRDLISAFSAAAKHQLTGAGWRKRTGDIYTMDLGDKYSAWLGLNKATKYHPMRVNPVVGVRHEPTMRLVRALMDTGELHTAPTLSEPIYVFGRADGLGPSPLAVGSIDEAESAAARLLELVDTYGLPFVRSLADEDPMLDALRQRKHLAIPEYAASRLPAMLAALGRADEARAAAANAVVRLGDRTDAAAEHYRRFAERLLAHLAADA